MSDGRRGSRRKKTNTGLVVGIIFAVTGIITLMIVLFMVGTWQDLKKNVADRAADMVVEKAVEQALESQGIPADDRVVNEVLEMIDPADKQAVSDIIVNHFDADTVTEVTGQLVSGDSAAAMDTMRENLSEEEMQTLLEMAEKYPGLIDQYVQ
ncbi:MAG: hypothetical protein IKO80_02800 [Lachnospiraceae bacterium]|nr:hypothetical protein [Lachnospiraceae bacterium]